MMSKKFKNFSNEDFTWKYDGVAYTFPAGQETYLEDFKADHFANHLVDREIHKENKVQGRTGNKEVSTASKPDRARLLALCFPGTDEVTPEVALNLNEESKAKRGRPKKADEFPDLNEPIQ